MVSVKFAHIGLTCRNRDVIELFYTKYFGFKRTRVVPTPEGQIVFITSGAVTFELFSGSESPLKPPEKDGYPYQGWRHVSFTVENVDAKLAEIGTAAKVTFGPFSFDELIHGWRTVWIADPEGNIIEISQGYKEQENPPDFQALNNNC